MKKLLCIVLLLSGFAFAQIGHYDNTSVTTRYINGIPAASPLPFSQVLVCSYPGPCNGATAATIYTDSTGTTQAPNPFITDIDGNFGFWATSGLYQYSFTYNGVVHGPYPVSIGGGGGQGAPGSNGADGAPGADGYTPNQIISGCGVGYVSGFTWTIGACNYWLGNHQYSAAQATITGPSADSTFDRFDVIAVDKNGVFSVVQGVAQASPAKPILDPSLQTEITFYRVNAGATTPADVTILDIYHENAEWTCSVSATMNCASTVNPHTGTKDVESTASPQGAFARFTIPAGTLDIGNYRDLVWNMALKAPLNTHSLIFQWYNGTTAKCTPVTVTNGQFNFNEALTSYQQIVIPLSTFNCAGIPVTRLQLTIGGTSTSTVGFYLDDIYLQGGVTNSTANSGMQWLRAWNATTVYKIQDTVNRNGSAYVAIATNSNLDPTVHPEVWDAIDCHQPAGVDGNIQIKSGNCYAAINSSYDVATQTVTFGGPVIAGGSTNQGVTIKQAVSPTVSAAGEIKFISNAGACQISQNGGSFVPCGAGGVAGSNQQVQFNDSGVFGADAQFFYDKSTHILTVGTSASQGTIDMLGAAGAPSNPSAGYCRQYFNTTSGKVEWINSSGASCGPSSAAAAPTTAQYITGAYDATLSAEAALSDAYNSYDVDPASPNALDDEFNGGSVSGSWTQVNAGTTTLTQGNSMLSFLTAAHSGDSIAQMYKAVPGSTPWEFTVKVLADYSNNSGFHFVGLCLNDSATGKITTYGPAYHSSTTDISVTNWTNQTTFSAYANNSSLWTTTWQRWLYVRVKNDGTNLLFSTSTTGMTWAQTLSVAKASFLANIDRVGICVDTNDASIATQAYFSFFRRTQ